MAQKNIIQFFGGNVSMCCVENNIITNPFLSLHLNLFF